MSGSETLTISALQALVAAALEASGTSPTNALSVARALVAAEADGQSGHGMSRVASYAAQVRAGKIDGQATPAMRATRSAAIAIDAAHGFAYPAFDLAVTALPLLTRTHGIAAAGVHRSHHAGALGLLVERLADAGCLALMFANTPSAMAPWGGKSALFGTNPVAFAAPRNDGPPLVIDLALSEVARGRIMAAARNGEAIPPGWAVDRQGQPTTNAKAALEGTLIPAGGAKGAALALMVELLAAALTGGRFAFEATSFLDDKGGPPSTGQFLVTIDPAAFDPEGAALERITRLCAMIEAEPGARLPGSRRHDLRSRAASQGIAVDTPTLAVIRALAGA